MESPGEAQSPWAIKEGDMAQGDRHVFADGYSFHETLHGPMNMGVCVDCGKDALEVGPTDRVNQWGLKEDTGAGIATRCSGCFRAYYGLD